MAQNANLCLLCCEHTEKFAKAHIIPRSMYGDTLKSSAGPAQIVTTLKDVHPTRSPKGEYDREILCLKCEASFSPYDDYAYDILFRTKFEPAFYHKGNSLVGIIDKIDIQKLQLFFMSLMWRMEVTTRAMFSSVRLGPYKEKLRSALQNADPFEVPEFDVIVTKFQDDAIQAVLGPSAIKMEGVNGYEISLAGYSCFIKLDKRKFPETYLDLALSSGNPFHVLYREFIGSPEFEAMVKIAKS